MTDSELQRAFEFTIATTSASQPEMRRLLTSVHRALQAGSAGEVVFPAIDWPVDGRPGGYAFLWKDVLDIGDLCEILVEGLTEPLLPNQLASVVTSLVSGWQKLRQVRIELDEDQFKILRAVKRGHRTPAKIAEITGLPVPTVESIVSDLQRKPYTPDVFILEANEHGTIITRF